MGALYCRDDNMAEIIRGRKGIYFTLITILLLSVLLISFYSRTYVSPKDDIPVTKGRVEMADNHVKNIRQIYVERALYVSSYWALEAMAEYANKTNSYFASRQELDSKFKEVMLNGSINGMDIDLITGRKIMNNNTLFHRLGQIENSSYDALRIKTNFSRDFSKYNVIIWQSNETGPWKVAVNTTASFVVDAEIVRWNQSIRVRTIFEIKGLHDPVYFAASSPPYQRIVEETNFTNWNVTNLYYHIGNGTYRSESNGTSFLDRFYNNFSMSYCCGIESNLNPNAMGIPDTDKSYIDWCFYSSRCPPNTEGQIWNVTGITSNNPAQNYYAYKIDGYHAVIYNVTSEAYH